MTDFELCMNCMSDTHGEKVCPVCGFQAEKPQPSQALPYRTFLQKRYIVGRVKKGNGEGISYIGYDTVLRMKIRLREFFPQTLCGRQADGMAARVFGGSELVFGECMSSFLSYAREIAHMRELSAIEQIYDIFEENNTAYTVSEWDESITLRYFVERSGGSLSWNSARQLFMPVLSALSALHAGGVSHLGISPDTLAIMRDGRMKLTDFCIGAVRRMDTDLPPDLAPGCAALEQYVMDYALDEGTDVYGFAASLFFALTGTLPQDALKRRTDSRLMIPTSILRALPPHVVTALANALQVLPEKRTARFERLRAELSAAPSVTAKIEETQPIARVPAPAAVEEKRGVPGFVWAIVSCVAALAVFVGIGALWLFPQTSSGPAESSMTLVSAAAEASADSSGLLGAVADSSEISGGDRIEVPDLVGKKFEDLTSSAGSGEADYEVLLSDKQFSDTVEEGRVIEQTPEAGTMVEKGTKIVVIVSEGAAVRTLPEIENLGLADASAKITSAGFTPVKADAYSDTVPAGAVIGYKDAKAGDKLNYGAQVTILLSRGPQPPSSAQAAPDSSAPAA